MGFCPEEGGHVGVAEVERDQRVGASDVLEALDWVAAEVEVDKATIFLKVIESSKRGNILTAKVC